MKNAGKDLLIEALGLEQLGLINLYETTGFFERADNIMAANLLATIDVFVDTLKTRGIVIEDKGPEFMDGVNTAITEIMELIEDHRTLVKSTVVEGLSV